MWRPRACNRRVPSLHYIASFCRLLSISDDNLFCDVSVVVQRHSRRVDCMHSLSYFSAVDIFLNDGFTAKLTGQLDFVPSGHAGVCIGQAAHLIDMTSDPHCL